MSRSVTARRSTAASLKRLAFGLLILGQLWLAPAALASGSVFAGTWTSTDVPDGSTQLLSVSANATPTVTYQDLFASGCANNGARSTHFAAVGMGSISGTALDVSFARSGCGAFQLGAFDLPFAYDADTDTLVDGFGITWHRRQ
jgi:hypothetical protein